MILMYFILVIIRLHLILFVLIICRPPIYYIPKHIDIFFYFKLFRSSNFFSNCALYWLLKLEINTKHPIKIKNEKNIDFYGSLMVYYGIPIVQAIICITKENRKEVKIRRK